MIGAGKEDNHRNINSKKYIPKCSFQLKKTTRDGLLLQLHHTLPDQSGNARSYRFSSASFDLPGERLAVSDPLGNAFVIDLLSSKFWVLPKLSANSFLVYSRYAPRKQDIMVGYVSGVITFVNADTGEVTGELSGHKTTPVSASFAEDEPFCLTMCKSSAIIWNLRSNTLLHQLALRSSVAITLVKFMPVSNNIFGLFDDSSVHIWRLEKLDCSKQIFPENWGGQNVKTVAFTRNGRGMVLGGKTAALAVFLLDNYSLQKLIALPEKYRGVKHLEFVPQLFDGGANKILAVISSNCTLLFVDTETSVLLKTLNQLDGCIGRLEVSWHGKYVVSVLQTGEVNIYASSQVLVGSSREELVSEAQAAPPSSKARRRSQTTSQVTASLDLNQLRPILKEFGEYPESHRTLVWKSILRLPENDAAYIGLINKGIHPSLSTLEKEFPLSDRSLLSSIKRVLSCLIYWSPIFLQVKYLPIFVLPFVKQIKHDQFACFEAIATIMVNWCQGWYQYVPYPALNVLDSATELFSINDSQLLAHYTTCQITPDIYIWSLLETAFYEVLGWSEWQQLWDHILSNHPAFLVYTVVAFNITCRTSLLHLRSVDEYQMFFHQEVVINMKHLLAKCYQLWSNNPSGSKLKHQIKPFKPLLKGNLYQVFTDYSKHLLDNQLDKLCGLYEDKVTLEDQEREVIKQIKSVEAERKASEENNANKTRSEELQGAYKMALRREEEILENQRRNMSSAWKDLREKEVTIRSHAMDKTIQDKAEKCAQLDRLTDQVTDRKADSKVQTCCSWTLSQHVPEQTSLRLQHASVVHHVSKLKQLCHHSNIGNNPQLKLILAKFEDLLGRIEYALANEGNVKRICHKEQILSLQEETHVLEYEAQELLKNVKQERVHPCHAKQTKGLRSKANSCYCCSSGQEL